MRRFWSIAAIGLIGSAATTDASIGLSLVSPTMPLNIGEQFSVDVWAFPSAAPEGMLSFQMIFSWQPETLHLNGFSNPSGVAYTALGFLRDPYGLNQTLNLNTAPVDGDAILIGLGPFGSTIDVPASGLMLSRLTFTALAPATSSPVGVLPSAGSPVGSTVVYGSAGANVDVTGALVGTTVQVVPTPATLGMVSAFVGVGVVRRRRVVS